jgi:hypothetical protein
VQNQKNAQYECDREFLSLSRKHKYTLIRPMVQELSSLQVGVLLEFLVFRTDQAIWTNSDFTPTSNG